MAITIRTREWGGGPKKLHILNTYAPHMSHNKNIVVEYREDVKYIRELCKEENFASIWTTDNNGQITKGRNKRKLKMELRNDTMQLKLTRGMVRNSKSI